MADNKDMETVIDWSLDETAFYNFVVDLVKECVRRGKVLPLPMAIIPGTAYLDTMTLLLSMINCDGCQAFCCRSNPNGARTGILKPEYERLAGKYGPDKVGKAEDGTYYLPSPCPFLKTDVNVKLGPYCSIYADRPLVCVLYPFQPGAATGDGNPVYALGSACPEARRITKVIYMMEWRLRHQSAMIDPKFLLGSIL